MQYKPTGLHLFALLVLWIMVALAPGSRPAMATPKPASVLGLAPLQNIGQIVAGIIHTCALTSSGGVKCWGWNYYGQVGDGTHTNRMTPVYVIGLSSGVKAITAGAFHTCALNTSGGVKCWGDNGNGRLGGGIIAESSPIPIDVSSLSSGVSAIAAGSYHTCALMTSGGIKCWGDNFEGRLGDGTITNRNQPVDVVGLKGGIAAITAGSQHTCALMINGSMKCWGWNYYGQLGDSTTDNHLTPVDVVGLSSRVSTVATGNNYTCVVLDTGGVQCWGANGFGQLGNGMITEGNTIPVNVIGLSNGVASIDAGDTHTCAVLNGNTVKCWGDNNFGRLGDGTTTNRSIPTDVVGLSGGVSAAAGGRHTCVLISNGSVKCWGSNGDGQLGDGININHTAPVDVVGMSNGMSGIGAGFDHTCALTRSSGMKCWGSNGDGQLGDNTLTYRMTPVDVVGLSSEVSGMAAGGYHTCALTTNGDVKCWGANSDGQLGDGTSNGHIRPEDVTSLPSGVNALTAGSRHTCALTSSGGVKCWGSNGDGQLGDGTTINRTTPVNVVGLTSGVKAITAGDRHTCAVIDNGSVKCWGRNSSGQLGDGTKINRTTPANVIGLSSGTSRVYSGSRHTCALTNSGGAKCWGANEWGQLGDGTAIDSTTPVDVVSLTSDVRAIDPSDSYTCALTSSGGVKCWGWNGVGELGDGTNNMRLTPVGVVDLSSDTTAIATGFGHSCALTISGGIKCWGGNAWGQLGDNNAWRTTPVDVVIETTCYRLTLTHNGNGSDPAATPANSAGCPVGQYVTGEFINLNATPAAGGQVTSWSGTANNTSAVTTNSLTMPANDHTVSVTYSVLSPICYPLTLSHSGSGSVPLAAPANSPSCAAGQYVAGESISLSASPAGGWQVIGWSGTTNDASTASNNSLIMPATNHSASVAYRQSADGDDYEIDNTCTQARTITTDGSNQEHTFHQAADIDWVQFTAETGATYRIEVQIPYGSPADVDLEVYGDCNSLPVERWSETFAPGVRLDFKATASTPVHLRLTNQDTAVAGTHVAYQLAVRKLTASPMGGVILVAGRLRTADRLQQNIHHITNAAYALFLAHGYTADDIYYLTTDPSLPGHDATATNNNLRLAITEWAASKVGNNQALTLYLVDHGDTDTFFLDQPNGERVSPQELDVWLAQLEATTPGLPINLIVETCYSGTFIQAPQSLSKAGRVIITSTSAQNVAYASRQGAYFSDYFITALQQGRNLFTSWHEARAYVRAFYPFQEPWLDANGNGLANETADYAIAAQRGFAYTGTLGDLWPPYIVQAQGPETILGRRGMIQAAVRDNRGVDNVWAVVYPPSYTPPASGQELVAEALDIFYLQQQGDGIYTGSYPGFVETGVYRVVIHADDADGLAAAPVMIEVSTGSRIFLPLVSR